jgi:NADH dehydrogenase FAD-containing subunit
MSEPFRMRRVVIADGGFAGSHAAHTIPAGEWPLAEARGRWGQVEIVLVSPADYFLSLPPLP